MNKKKEILILNTGGTFNKIYDLINGILVVPKGDRAIKKIIKLSKIYDIKVTGIIYKDSLDINNYDRKKLVNYIKKSKFHKIIIVHGTDTINITAKYLSKYIIDKQIILTGSMVPFSINPIEATSNLMNSYGFLKNNNKSDIYISMHGLIEKHKRIKKNKILGVFECQ